MALNPGTKLGSYEVSGLLGKGGMGEVYRARDSKLGREVAIKTLPAEFASDPDRLARLGREARLLASLNHSNVGGIYGLEEEGEARFLVLELIEGETLAERLTHRPLPVEQSLRIALQIASALEAAHAKGIIHRDLKPGNIKVTPEGTVKVLDFGLAKDFGPRSSGADLSHSPTLSLTATVQGVILGTAGYMSPQQARGEAVDTQADIWAFGCILFEMLSGRQTWSGRSATDIIASLVAREPEWSLLPAGLHPRIRFALERCLEKEVEDRYRDIADARVEITRALSDPAGLTVGPSKASAPRRAVLISAAAAAAVVGAIAGAAAWRYVTPAAPQSVARFSLEAPEPGTTIPPIPSVAVSRDGARWAVSSIRQIYLRNLGEAEARPIPGAAQQAVFSPAFSPDGQWLAYVEFTATGAGAATAGSIRKIPISGGSPQTIAKLTGVTSDASATNVYVSWDDQDRITWVRPDGIMQVSANGGEPTLVVRALEGEALASPQVLPDGNSILFTTTTTAGPGQWDTAQIAVQSIGADDRTVVWRGGRDARYVPTGHLVYAQGATLFGVPFNVGRREVTGGQTPLVEGLPRFAPLTATAQFAVSDTGLLVYLSGGAEATGVATGNAPPPRTLAWVDRKGQETPLRIRADDYTTARLSPDGRKAALVVGNAVGAERPSDIWIYDLATENSRQLTFEKADDDGPVWTSSDRLFFRSFRDGDETHGGLYAMSADGGAADKVAMSPDFPFALPWSITPDNKTLALVNAKTLQEVDLARVDVGGNGGFQPLLSEPGIETEPVIAPNGQWIAYGLQTGSGQEINIRPFPDVTRQRFPVGPGSHPVFSRDGSELFFFDGQGISVVSIAYTPAFRIGSPQSLFKGLYWYGVAGPNGNLGRAWDVDRSGQRFLMVQIPGAPAATAGKDAPPPPPIRVNVVLNWLDEVKRLMPSR